MIARINSTMEMDIGRVHCGFWSANF